MGKLARTGKNLILHRVYAIMCALFKHVYVIGTTKTVDPRGGSIFMCMGACENKGPLI